MWLSKALVGHIRPYSADADFAQCTQQWSVFDDPDDSGEWVLERIFTFTNRRTGASFNNRYSGLLRLFLRHHFWDNPYFWLPQKKLSPHYEFAWILVVNNSFLRLSRRKRPFRHNFPADASNVFDVIHWHDLRWYTCYCSEKWSTARQWRLTSFSMGILSHRWCNTECIVYNS